jgi:6-pyruvoyltetrahydropterin/6-carboxytetrahydropterin synthase
MALELANPQDYRDSLMYQLSQKFHFDAAHTLRRDIDAQGSRRVHGHTYQCEISFSGEVNPKTGMVMDLGVLRQAIVQVRDALDHHFLDEVVGIGIPTLENLCKYIHAQISPQVQQITSVRVWRDSVGDSCLFLPEKF